MNDFLIWYDDGAAESIGTRFCRAAEQLFQILSVEGGFSVSWIQSSQVRSNLHVPNSTIVLYVGRGDLRIDGEPRVPVRGQLVKFSDNVASNVLLFADLSLSTPRSPTYGDFHRRRRHRWHLQTMPERETLFKASLTTAIATHVAQKRLLRVREICVHFMLTQVHGQLAESKGNPYEEPGTHENLSPTRRAPASPVRGYDWLDGFIAGYSEPTDTLFVTMPGESPQSPKQNMRSFLLDPPTIVQRR